MTGEETRMNQKADGRNKYQSVTHGVNGDWKKTSEAQSLRKPKVRGGAGPSCMMGQGDRREVDEEFGGDWDVGWSDAAQPVAPVPSSSRYETVGPGGDCGIGAKQWRLAWTVDPGHSQYGKTILDMLQFFIHLNKSW